MNKVLCIIQARMGSRRLPGKVLLPINGKPLIQIAWEKACEAFGRENVVVSVPFANGENWKLFHFLNQLGAVWNMYGGDENDVLGRFYRVAELSDCDPDDILHRWTPDDHRKSPAHCRRVAAGEKGIPVELGGEAFTFAQLKEWHETVTDPNLREHIGLLVNPNPAPCPPGLWSIDTEADWLRACGEMAMDAA